MMSGRIYPIILDSSRGSRLAATTALIFLCATLWVAGPVDAQNLACVDYATQPQPVATLDVPQGSAMDVVPYGSAAYVTAVTKVVVVDWSVPANPSIATDLSFASGIRAAAVGNDALYVIDGIGQLLVFDLADPLAPAAVAVTPSTAPSVDLAVDEGMAYLALEAGGLQVVDLTDPLDPVAGAQLALDDGNRAIAVHGQRAYVVGVGLLDHEFGAFHVVNLADPEQPVALGSHFTEGEGVGWYDIFLDVTAGPGGVFVVHESSWYDWDAGYTYLDRFLRRMDVDDPNDPDLGASVIAEVEHLAAITLGDLVVSVGHATGPQDPWCPDCEWEDARLAVQNCDATTSERLLFELPLPDDVRGVAWAADHLLIAAGEAGLLIHTAPMLAPDDQSEIGVGVLPLYDLYGQAAAIGGEWLVASRYHEGGCYPGDETHSTLKVYDLADGGPFDPVGSWSHLYSGPFYDLVFYGDSYLYANQVIFEISSGGSIDQVGLVPEAHDRAVVAGTYLVGSDGSDLRSWDLADPASPVAADELTSAWNIDALAAVDDLVFGVADGNLFMVQVAGNGELLLTALESLPWTGTAIWADGEHLAVGGEGGQLALYSHTNGIDLDQLAVLDLGATVTDVELGSQLYAAVSEKGWAVIDVNDWFVPEVEGWVNGHEAVQVVSADDALVLVDRCTGSVLVTGQACSGVTGIGDLVDGANRGAGFVRIDGVWPNPANPRLAVAFEVLQPAMVRAEIFDLAGRRVVTLSDESRIAGRHVVEWNGRWQDGREAATGVYLLQVSAEGTESARKVVLVR